MHDVQNKNSEKGEIALKLVFAGEQELVTKGWQGYERYASLQEERFSYGLIAVVSSG